jgi:hypothetical protein
MQPRQIEGPVKIDLPFDEAIRRALKVKPAPKPAPKKRKPKARR